MTPLPAVELLGPPRKKRLRILAASYGVGLAWAMVTTTLAEIITLNQMMAWIIAPAVVTVVTIPEVRARWWRWPAVWAIFGVTYFGYAPFVLGLGLGWILHDAFIRKHTVPVAAAALEPETPDEEPVRLEPADRKKAKKNRSEAA